MKTGSLLFILMLATIAPSFRQNAADFDAKYHRVTSYEVRPGIVMTPKYDADGQVCEMVLEKRQKTDTGIVFGYSFSEKEVKGLVDELVPEVQRGKNLMEPLNETVAGGFIVTDYTYENILIRVYGITRPEPAGNMVVVIAWRKRGCGDAKQPQ
jgi:hypothetical protein